MDNLAKINLSKDEKEEIKQYMESLLSYVEVLDEINMDEEYEKTIYSKNNTTEEGNTLYDDKVKDSLCQSTLPENAPSEKDGYFTVPNDLSNQNLK